MRTIYKLYNVDKRRIGFLKFIFEAHDGLAVITTLNARDGLIRFAVAPGCMDDVKAILDDLKKDISIEEVNSEEISIKKTRLPECVVVLQGLTVGSKCYPPPTPLSMSGEGENSCPTIKH